MDAIQIVLSIATLIISVLTCMMTLIISNRQANIARQADVIVKQRRDRIDLLRKLSASILSYSKMLMMNIDDKEDDIRKELIKAVNYFAINLQYIYPRDIELIDLAYRIESRLTTNDPKDCVSLQTLLESFWRNCDLYIGTEYERLKCESSGVLTKCGDTYKQETQFEDIYRKLENKFNYQTNNES